MPMNQVIAAGAVETLMQVTCLLDVAAPNLTSNQYAALHRLLRTHAPCSVALAQRTPKSVVTITITKPDTEIVYKINNRSKLFYVR